MADPNHDRFDERLKAIGSKQAPGRRVENVVRDDGLVVQVSKRGMRGYFPYKTILLILFLGLVTKGFLFARIGEAEYQARIDAMANGSSIESAASVVLSADPVTKQIARLVSLILP